MKFDKKSLPKEVKGFLETGGIAQAYEVSTKISSWLEENPDPDPNTLLCAAHYEWACAMLTELDDDIIGFGEEALELLERVLVIDPDNEEALKQKTKLEKKVKKAKRDYEAILKWEKDDLNEMSKGVISELAFYYFEKATRSPEFAEKGFRYYQRIYEFDLLEEELPQDSLYHFATMAYCKYYSEGYEAAKELIAQTLNWELTPKFKIYDFKVTDVWVIEWNHLASISDFPAFEASFQRWYKTMKAIRPDEEPDSADHDLLTPVVKWLMTIQEGASILNYILTNCYPVLAKKKIDLTDYDSVREAIRQF